MRQITASQILAFMVMLGVIVAISLALTWAAGAAIPAGDLRGVALALVFVVFFYGTALAVYRGFLRVFPLGSGYIPPGTREEFSAQVNILFYLLLFNTLIRTHFIPVPLMRLIYIALGAKLGANTYSAGAILDPPLTTIGANCIIGHDAVIFAHAIEGSHFSLSPVSIGDEATVGAMAAVMSGVTIGRRAIVSAGAVVVKDTVIGDDEIWGGIPARRIGVRPSEQPPGA